MTFLVSLFSTETSRGMRLILKSSRQGRSSDWHGQVLCGFQIRPLGANWHCVPLDDGSGRLKQGPGVRLKRQLRLDSNAHFHASESPIIRAKSFAKKAFCSTCSACSLVAKTSRSSCRLSCPLAGADILVRIAAVMKSACRHRPSLPSERSTNWFRPARLNVFVGYGRLASSAIICSLGLAVGVHAATIRSLTSRVYVSKFL